MRTDAVARLQSAAGPGSRAALAGWAAFAVMGAAQFLIPMLVIGSGPRVALNVLTVLAMATASVAFAAGRWGLAAAAGAALAVGLLTVLAEGIGVATGWPFGRYEYTGVLQPAVAGVPLLIPLAWFGLGLPAREVAARLGGGPVARVLLGSIALTAWDLFLDPQMLAEGFWTWDGGGFYRGVPATNYAGWLAVSALVMIVLERLLPPGVRTPPGRATRPLLFLYAWMAGMETIAFLVLFGDPLVGAVGGLVMGGFAVAAWARRPRAHTWRRP